MCCPSIPVVWISIALFRCEVSVDEEEKTLEAAMPLLLRYGRLVGVHCRAALSSLRARKTNKTAMNLLSSHLNVLWEPLRKADPFELSILFFFRLMLRTL